MQWLGVDVGGTFTDLVLYNQASGALSVEKVPSTPADPSIAMLAGIARMGIAFETVAKLPHGTTVATRSDRAEDPATRPRDVGGSPIVGAYLNRLDRG